VNRMESEEVILRLVPRHVVPPIRLGNELPQGGFTLKSFALSRLALILKVERQSGSET